MPSSIFALSLPSALPSQIPTEESIKTPASIQPNTTPFSNSSLLGSDDWWPPQPRMPGTESGNPHLPLALPPAACPVGLYPSLADASTESNRVGFIFLLLWEKVISGSLVLCCFITFEGGYLLILSLPSMVTTPWVELLDFRDVAQSPPWSTAWHNSKHIGDASRSLWGVFNYSFINLDPNDSPSQAELHLFVQSESDLIHADSLFSLMTSKVIMVVWM